MTGYRYWDRNGLFQQKMRVVELKLLSDKKKEPSCNKVKVQLFTREWRRKQGSEDEKPKITPDPEKWQTTERHRFSTESKAAKRRTNSPTQKNHQS